MWTLRQHPTATTSQQQIKLGLPLSGVPTVWDRMDSTLARGKENKRLRSAAGEVKSPLSIQLDRGTQRSLYVWIFF